MNPTSFNMGGRQTTEEMVETYSLRVMKPGLTRAIKGFKNELGRLQQHKVNFVKFKNEANMEELEREQINATLTIKKLRSDVQELERVKAKVRVQDKEEFAKMMGDIQSQMATGIEEFVSVFTVDIPVDDTAASAPTTSEPSTIEPTSREPKIKLSMLEVKPDEAPGSLQQIQKQKQLESPDHDAEKNLQRLEENLGELNQLMHDFQNLVHEQQQTVDDIEANVTSADENVEEGTTILADAAKYSQVALPLAGGLFGLLVGGPVGAIVGAKAAGAVGIGSSILGYTGGRYLKNKLKSDVDAAEFARLEELEAARNPDPADQDASPTPDPYHEDPHAQM